MIIFSPSKKQKTHSCEWAALIDHFRFQANATRLRLRQKAGIEN
jgi:hypothetical protein